MASPIIEATAMLAVCPVRQQAAPTDAAYALMQFRSDAPNDRDGECAQHGSNRFCTALMYL